MYESNQTILMRYYQADEELDVFLNGNKLYTFIDANAFPYQLVEFLENLGYKNFEKQMYEKRTKPRLENVKL